MFTCSECKQKKKEKERVFQNQAWCHACVEVENKRSKKEDLVDGRGFIRSRPQKYMLTPDQYKEYGYE